MKFAPLTFSQPSTPADPTSPFGSEENRLSQSGFFVWVEQQGGPSFFANQ